MKKLLVLILTVLMLLSLAACDVASSRNDATTTAESLPKGRAERIACDYGGVYFENADFEYVNTNTVKITTKIGEVYYIDSAHILYIQAKE